MNAYEAAQVETARKAAQSGGEEPDQLSAEGKAVCQAIQAQTALLRAIVLILLAMALLVVAALNPPMPYPDTSEAGWWLDRAGYWGAVGLALALMLRAAFHWPR